MNNPPATVTASTPGEMAMANSGIVAWCDRKVENLHIERAELESNLASAIKHKWKVSGLKNAVKRVQKRVTYFEKIQSAVRQGFHIIPSFQGNVAIFAVRVDKKKPKRLLYRYGVPDIRGKGLEEGSGRYVDPKPYTCEVTKTDKKGEEYTEDYASDFDEEISFPFDMAKPRIMELTSRAMALQLFDEIGIIPDRRSVDPIIVGRIKDPRAVGQWDERCATFLIAWHLDLNDL